MSAEHPPDVISLRMGRGEYPRLEPRNELFRRPKVILVVHAHILEEVEVCKYSWKVEYCRGMRVLFFVNLVRDPRVGTPAV